MHPNVREVAKVPCRLCGMALELQKDEGAYLCLEHAAEDPASSVDIQPGKCKKCGKDLVAAKLAVVHDCPEHGSLSLPEPGNCLLCKKKLVQRTAAVIWTCPNHAGVARLEQGQCPLCKRALERAMINFPHGDHNPKHGGVFFMASDHWHHVEGALVSPDTFRLYLYDNFTQPIPPSGIAGTLSIVSQTDSGETAEEAAPIPLADLGSGLLEARVAGIKLPLEVVLRLTLRPDAVEPERFDFRFERLSLDRPELLGAAPGAPRQTSAIQAPPSKIAMDLAERAQQVKRLLENHALTEIYRPALEAKDIALSLLDTTTDQTIHQKEALEAAVANLVRTAWLLDLNGDGGNLPKVKKAHEGFQTAVAALLELIATKPNQ